MQKNTLPVGQAPSRLVLSDDNMDFIGAITTRKISYNDILMEAGYPINEIPVVQEIGNNLHAIFKQMILKYTRDRGCASFQEVYVNTNSKNKDYRFRHCDITILVDETLKKLSPALQAFCNKNPDIKIINIDCFLGNSYATIRDHCSRGYQDNHKFLILVPSHCRGDQLPPRDIHFRNHVKIDSAEEFAKLFGLDSENEEDLKATMRFARDAFTNNDIKETLSIKAKESKKIVRESYQFTNQEFKEMG